MANGTTVGGESARYCDISMTTSFYNPIFTDNIRVGVGPNLSFSLDFKAGLIACDVVDDWCLGQKKKGFELDKGSYLLLISTE